MKGDRAMQGLTLVELLVGVAVAAVLLGVAVPSFTGMLARSRLEGVLNELGTDLQYTRSEALRQRTTTTLLVNGSGTGYAVTVAGTTLKSVTPPTSVTLTPDASISFDALRGLSNAAAINASATGTPATLRIGTNGAGRVQVCSPSGNFPGYATC
jgi:type IV fimbrial biogenesis protein FimT